MKRKGFTLIELMIVMAIIAVLSMLIVAAIQAARNASKESQNRGNAKTIETAMEAYAGQHQGTYPAAGTYTFTAAATGAALLQPYVTGTLSSSCTGATNAGGGQLVIGAGTFTISIANAACSGFLTETITH